MTQGGFGNGAMYFARLWGKRIAVRGQRGAPTSIADFVDRLTENAPKYNSLDKASNGDPRWKEKVTNNYNGVLKALKDPNCRPESPPSGCP
jgi:hypothetical protein